MVRFPVGWIKSFLTLGSSCCGGETKTNGRSAHRARSRNRDHDLAFSDPLIQRHGPGRLHQVLGSRHGTHSGRCHRDAQGGEHRGRRGQPALVSPLRKVVRLGARRGHCGSHRGQPSFRCPPFRRRNALEPAPQVLVADNELGNIRKDGSGGSIPLFPRTQISIQDIGLGQGTSCKASFLLGCKLGCHTQQSIHYGGRQNDLSNQSRFRRYGRCDP
jgi:hypothetical protein